ncbi:MAG: tetratricopeptide repeat protein [Candidatus Competibacteraceae bacterium]|nr:MAG: tetratricopeptide repeat protein [Candidatus Competibacteraceae bacterium]
MTHLRKPAWLLAMWLAAIPAFAQNLESNRFYVQQMIERAAANDEHGVVAMQRMLEQNPRPAAADPAAANAMLQAGLAALRQDDSNAALTAFQQAVQMDPGNIEAANHLGLVYRKLGQWTEAERALQQALSLEPTRAVAWFQLAQVYGLQNDVQRATGALANTYRYAQNPMRAEEILRNIAENEAADTLRNAALATLRLQQLPVADLIMPPLAPNSDMMPMTTPANPLRPPRSAP